MNDLANNTPNHQPLARVVNLLDPSRNVIYGMTHEQATEIVAAGEPEAVRKIDGHFALVGVNGTNVRLARTIGKLMRYFIAKRVPPTDTAAFAEHVASAIRPYNTAGLCNPERHNMYSFTGAL